jgi:proteasome ATPase
LRVVVSPTVDLDGVRRGQEVMLNEALNVVAALEYEEVGEVVLFKEVLADGDRVLVLANGDSERVVRIAEPLRDTVLRAGDSLLLDTRSNYVYERVPKSEVEELVLEEVPDIEYAAIGGLVGQIEQIRDAVELPYLYPELFEEHQLKPPKGVLLYGPPGCGKTLISKATAGEIEANFLSIGIHQILDLYIGESEKNLHRLFEMARDNAPAILFFDEVDALAADRRDMRKSAGRTLINQFLAEMDGNVASNEGILILGATNAPWHIDPAFRRPGRFDRILFVPPPDDPARISILTLLAKGKPLADFNAKELAQKTKDFSGADLKAIFDHTVEKSLAVAMKRGQIVPITQRDLLEVAKSLKPSTKAWFESAKNYALYSNQGGFYNDVLAFLGIKK